VPVTGADGVDYRAEQRVAQEGSSPSDAQMRGVISKSGGNSSLAEGRERCWVIGNRAKPNRNAAAKAKAQPRATGRLKPLSLFSTFLLLYFGGQGVHREVESEGPAEKYRAAIDGETRDKPVSQRWVRSSPLFGGEGVLIHPPHQGVCGWHGTEEQHVTSGELAEFPGGAGISGPISASEVASDALSVVGRPNSTDEAW
jgi:hypothetical protein